MGFDFGAIANSALEAITGVIDDQTDAARKAAEYARNHLLSIDSPAVVSTPENDFIGPPEPTYNPPDSIDSFNAIAGKRSVADRFNMSDADVNAYVNTIAKEAYLGSLQPDGTYKDIEDIHAVAANLLTRQVDPRWPNTMLGVTKDPGQYEANFGFTRDQMSTPNVVGLTPAEWNRIKKEALNSDAILEAAKLTDFAEEYRGLSPQTKRGINPKTGQLDYMPVEGKSNFYFYPAPQATQDKLLAAFSN